MPGTGNATVGDKMEGVGKAVDGVVSEPGSGRSSSRHACIPGGHISEFNKEM